MTTCYTSLPPVFADLRLRRAILDGRKWGGAKKKKIRKTNIFKLVRYAALICLRRVKKITVLRFLTKTIDQQKNAKLKKSIHQTVFCEKRQMGNVLLIIIFGIRHLLAELSPSKVNFTEKNSHLLAGLASTF